jgi:hypothetical protein
MAASYIPAMDWSPLAQLGQTIVGNLQAGQKQQLLSQLGEKFGSGDISGAANIALQSGDLQTAMSLFSMGKQLEADRTAQAIASGQPQSAVSPAALPKGEVAQYIVQAARQRGIDPSIALRVYQSEGAGGYVGDNGSSFGPMMLHYGGVAPGGNAVPGLGDEFTKATGLDARDPKTWRQQVDFALDRAVKDGWGAWHGWKGDPRAGLPTQVADASGAVPASAMPQGDGEAGRLMTRYQNISRALQTPGLSADTARRLQSQADMLWKQIEFVSKDANRAPVALSEGQILVDPRTGRQIAAGGPKNDVARQNAQREAEATRLGLQGEDRTQYVLNGRVATGVEKQTGEQANAATFATRMAEADKIISDPAIFGAGMGASGALRDIASSVPVVGNMAIGATQGGAAYQKFDQAKRDFVNAVLRKESGAAISSSEFANAEKQYFPRPGDTPEVIAQKAKNRATAIDTIANAGGASFRKEFAEKRKGAQSAPPDVLAQARDAISRGAPREAVLQRLQQNGFDVSGL